MESERHVVPALVPPKLPEWFEVSVEFAVLIKFVPRVFSLAVAFIIGVLAVLVPLLVLEESLERFLPLLPLLSEERSFQFLPLSEEEVLLLLEFPPFHQSFASAKLVASLRSSAPRSNADSIRLVFIYGKIKI